MKKFLALLLAGILCFSLCACGGEKEKITVESLAGTYKARLWFLDETLTLNSNTTYDSDSYGKNGKGTFDFYKDNSLICLKPYAKYPPNMKVTNDYIYESSYWIFEEDNEYGLKFSPDEKGMTDQTFDYWITDASMPGSNSYNRIILDLNKDGTFELKLGFRSYNADSILETFNGTYYSDSSALTLKYEGKDYPLYIDVDGNISFIIYDKVA